jgi:DNA-directed RNA polymerase specialized sigma subunit
MATASLAAEGMYRFLASGETMSREDVLQASAARVLAGDYPRAVEVGRASMVDKNALLSRYAAVGARILARRAVRGAVQRKRVFETKKGYRASAKVAAEWRDIISDEQVRRPREPEATQEFGSVTEYGGMTEWEGWSYAPLKGCDVAHVRLVTEVPSSVLREAFPGWEVSETADGMLSVAAHVGAPVKEVVTEWLDSQGVHHEGVRCAENVRRRDLDALPASFLHDLVTTTLPIVHGVIGKRHAASMEVLASGYDDVSGYLRLWVIECALTFDAQLGRPFGTWATNRLKWRVQDLNRELYGRTASDLMIKHRRVEEKFQEQIAQGGPAPTRKDFAAEFGVSEAGYEQKRIALHNLKGIHGAAPLETGPDAPEIILPDGGPSPEDGTMRREAASRIAMALLSAAGCDDDLFHRPDDQLRYPLGFLGTICMEYNDMVKSDVVYLSGAASTKLQRELKVVHASLRETLADMSSGELV